MGRIVWAGVLVVCFALQINRLFRIYNITEDEVYRKVPKEKRRYCIFDTLFAILWAILGATILIVVLYEIFTGGRLI